MRGPCGDPIWGCRCCVLGCQTSTSLANHPRPRTNAKLSVLETLNISSRRNNRAPPCTSSRMFARGLVLTRCVRHATAGLPDVANAAHPGRIQLKSEYYRILSHEYHLSPFIRSTDIRNLFGSDSEEVSGSPDEYSVHVRESPFIGSPDERSVHTCWWITMRPPDQYEHEYE